MKVYLDNAASSVMDPEVLEEMKPFLLGNFGNPSSSHAHGRVLRSAIEKSRRTIAKCLGASPGEIFFTSGGTEADNTAILGAVEAYHLTHIVSTHIEHHAVTHSIKHLEAAGKVKATYLQPDSKGAILLEDLREVLAQNPRSLVALMHANNELGTLNDIQAIGEICKEYDALFFSDTVQAMSNFEYDLAHTHLHFATASAHKFYGPKGVGFLYIKKDINIPSFILGGGQERNMRAGTENVAFIAGMAFALHKCCSKLEAKLNKLNKLKFYMKEQLLKNIPGVDFNGETDPALSLPTILNTAFPCGEEDAMLTFHLDLAGISASGGSACNSGTNLGSHVLRGIGCSTERAINSVRFSFGLQNTFEEIDYTIHKLKEIVKIPVT